MEKINKEEGKEEWEDEEENMVGVEGRRIPDAV